MTTATLSPASPTTRYGIRQLIRSEVAKITTLRSTLWVALITVAGMGLVTFLATHNVLHRSVDWYQGFDPTNQSLTGSLVAVLTIGVFGVLVVTGEYSSGTIRTSLSAAPRRPLFMFAKAVVAGAAMLVVAEVLSFACFFLGQSVLSGGGAPSAHLAQPGVARAVIFTGVVLALLGLMGMGLGFLIRNTAGAISAYVGVAFLLPLLLHQLSEHLARYAPVQILANSVSATVKNPAQVSPTVGLLLMLAYAAAVLVAGGFQFVTRDA